MSKKSTWGGARPHPPSKEGGRPKKQYPTRLLKLQMTDAEWQEFLDSLPRDTRKRAELLINLINSLK